MGARILVVDDEQSVREFFEILLNIDPSLLVNLVVVVGAIMSSLFVFGNGFLYSDVTVFCLFNPNRSKYIEDGDNVPDININE